MTTTRHGGVDTSVGVPTEQEAPGGSAVPPGPEAAFGATDDTDPDTDEAPTAEASSTDDADGHVCPVGFCPIGMAVNATGEIKPEAIGHLLVAGRELLLAAKAVVESRADEVDEAVSRFQKIDIG